MIDPGGSNKIIKFYLTTGVASPTTLLDITNNQIRGSFSYSRIIDTGKTSVSMTKIVHLDAGDYVRLFQTDNYTGIYVLPDSATMNIELIQAD
jgi:hypothetical protein